MNGVIALNNKKTYKLINKWMIYNLKLIKL